MPINFKQIAFKQNRAAMLKAFSGEDVDFNVGASIINLWFTSSQSRLSKKNIEFGKKHLQILRERTQLADLEKQGMLDRLDFLVVKALENLKKREQAREKAAAEPKVDRRLKAAPTVPAPDNDPWSDL